MALAFDVYQINPPGDSITFLATLDDAIDRNIRVERNGTGSGEFRISRLSAHATAAILAPGNLVKVREPSIDAAPIFAFFLETGDFTAVSAGEQGGEILHFGGRGPLAYWDNAVWLTESYVVQWWDGAWGTPPAGTLGRVDIAAGTYRHYTVTSPNKMLSWAPFTTGATSAWYDRVKEMTWAAGTPLAGKKGWLFRVSSGTYSGYWLRVGDVGNGFTWTRASMTIGQKAEFANIGDGTKPGQILERIYQEVHHANRPSHPLPLVTIDFTSTLDSAGNAWASTDALLGITAELGEPYLSTIFKLLETNVVNVEMDANLCLHAWNTRGRDLTSATFAAGKVRFAKGANIATELRRERTDGPVATFTQVVGNSEDAVAQAQLADAASRVARETTTRADTDDTTALAALGLADLNGRLVRSDALGFAIATGTNDATGLYLPGPPGSSGGKFWVGDLVTIYTGTGTQDWNNASERVAAITISEDEAANLNVIVELGSNLRPYGASTGLTGNAGRSGSSGTSGGPGVSGPGMPGPSVSWDPLYAATLVGKVKVVTSLPALPDPDYGIGQQVLLTTDQKMYRNVDDTTWTAAIPAVDITGVLASANGGVERVATLPVSFTNYPSGSVVVLTTDQKLYRSTGSAWTNAVPTADLSGTIATGQLAALSVTSDKLAANSVIAGKIAAGTIVADDIAAATITGAKIAANTITSSQIAADTITAGQIAAGAIGADEIAANAITAAKLSVGSQQGANAVLNGSFEDIDGSSDALRWTKAWLTRGAGFSISTTDSAGYVAGGTRSYRLATGTAGDGGAIASAPFPVTPGDRWYASMWASTAQTVTGGLYFRIEYGATETFTQATEGGVLEIAANYGLVLGTPTHIHGYATIPAGALWARVTIWHWATNVAADIHFDEVIAYRLSSGVVNSSANTVVDNNGVAITGGALTVTNAGGTVVIDGTSNMFKIAASGTLSINGPAAGNNTSASTTLSTGFAYAPTFHGWIELSGSLYADILPFVTIVAATGVVQDKISMFVRWLAGNSTEVWAEWQSKGGVWGTGSFTTRYYVLKEAAF